MMVVVVVVVVVVDGSNGSYCEIGIHIVGKMVRVYRSVRINCPPRII